MPHPIIDQIPLQKYFPIVVSKRFSSHFPTTTEDKTNYNLFSLMDYFLFDSNVFVASPMTQGNKAWLRLCTTYACKSLERTLFLCNVLLEYPKHHTLAFRLGLQGLELRRPPASSKALEVSGYRSSVCFVHIIVRYTKEMGIAGADSMSRGPLFDWRHRFTQPRAFL